MARREAHPTEELCPFDLVVRDFLKNYFIVLSSNNKCSLMSPCSELS